jgi:hypothetical protein
VAAVLFPPVGIGIAAAGASRAAIGGVAGHAKSGMPRGDLKDLGEALDSGTASLIAVYETNLADQVAANIKAANRVISKETDVDAEMKAEQSAPIPEQAGQPTAPAARRARRPDPVRPARAPGRGEGVHRARVRRARIDRGSAPRRPSGRDPDRTIGAVAVRPRHP